MGCSFRQNSGAFQIYYGFPKFQFHNFKVGLHQFKVSNGDYTYVEKLKYYDCLGFKSSGKWLAVDAVLESAGPDCIVPGQATLVKLLEEDVKSSLWSIDDDKAPGPDGFSSKFFKASWDIIKSDICEAVLSFFDHGCLLKQVNNTFLTMVPKTEDAVYVSQFSPIACCNVLYKIISKLLCTRLKTVLPYLISENQSAFVEGRSILDNILVCQDMLKNYNNKRKAPRCTVKVDMRKAYDSVHWSFNKDMMVALNFPPQFVGWVMECVTTPYSVMLNGGLHGFFQREERFSHSPEKTAVYCGSMDSVKEEEILDGYGFIKGDFPFRYLGISLNANLCVRCCWLLCCVFGSLQAAFWLFGVAALFVAGWLVGATGVVLGYVQAVLLLVLLLLCLCCFCVTCCLSGLCSLLPAGVPALAGFWFCFWLLANAGFWLLFLFLHCCCCGCGFAVYVAAGCSLLVQAAGVFNAACCLFVLCLLPILAAA
uniref:Reverse transcriptase domain-containing protein n=1 Tax=Chenopodium quinoa TaxID=63459 RepID=A0A803N4X8_CHEQI